MSLPYTLASADGFQSSSTRQEPSASIDMTPWLPTRPQALSETPEEDPDQDWQEAADAAMENKDWPHCYRLSLDAIRRHSTRPLSAALARAYVLLGRCLGAAGDDERAELRLNAGLQIARLIPDSDLELDALKELIELQLRLQKYAAMELHIEATLQVIASASTPHHCTEVFVWLASALLSHASVLAAQGQVAAARAQCHRAIDLQLSVWNDPCRLARDTDAQACENMARAHLILGEFAPSARYAIALLRAGRQRGDAAMQARACDAVAQVHVANRRPVRAIRWLTSACNHWRPSDVTLEHAASLTALSLAKASAGHARDATNLLWRAEAISCAREASRTALRIALQSFDTTAERQASLEAETLSHSNRLTILGSMVASISHEVLQPLSAIRLLAEDALEVSTASDRSDTDARVRTAQSLNRILELVDRLTTHIDHLKRFARREKPTIARLPVAAIVKDALTIVEPKRKACMATVSVAFNADEMFVMGDMASSTAILVNLLSNALDAVTGLRPALVSLSCKASTTQVWLEIRDQGCGLELESLPHLFRPWFTTKGADKGLGLGLALSKEIAEKMGGQLEGCNHPEGGAVFRLALPRAPRLTPAFDAPQRVASA